MCEELRPQVSRPSGQQRFHRWRAGPNHLSQKQPSNNRTRQSAVAHTGTRVYFSELNCFLLTEPHFYATLTVTDVARGVMLSSCLSICPIVMNAKSQEQLEHKLTREDELSNNIAVKSRLAHFHVYHIFGTRDFLYLSKMSAWIWC